MLVVKILQQQNTGFHIDKTVSLTENQALNQLIGRKKEDD